eukprot:353529-Chlamydomonas_euryale.AAC.12
MSSGHQDGVVGRQCIFCGMLAANFKRVMCPQTQAGRQAGRQAEGRQAGRRQAGRRQAGRQAEGRQAEGRQKAGRQKAGRQKACRRQAGRQAEGRQKAGRQAGTQACTGRQRLAGASICSRPAQPAACLANIRRASALLVTPSFLTVRIVSATPRS